MIILYFAIHAVIRLRLRLYQFVHDIRDYIDETPCAYIKIKDNIHWYIQVQKPLNDKAFGISNIKSIVNAKSSD